MTNTVNIINHLHNVKTLKLLKNIIHILFNQQQHTNVLKIVKNKNIS